MEHSIYPGAIDTATQYSAYNPSQLGNIGNKLANAKQQLSGMISPSAPHVAAAAPATGLLQPVAPGAASPAGNFLDRLRTGATHLYDTVRDDLTDGYHTIKSGASNDLHNDYDSVRNEVQNVYHSLTGAAPVPAQPVVAANALPTIGATAVAADVIALRNQRNSMNFWYYLLYIIILILILYLLCKFLSNRARN